MHILLSGIEMAGGIRTIEGVGEGEEGVLGDVAAEGFEAAWMRRSRR